MGKNAMMEEMVEAYKELSPFETIELGEIMDDFKMGRVEEYEDKIEITPPRVKKIAEIYINKMTEIEREEFCLTIDVIEGLL